MLGMSFLLWNTLLMGLIPLKNDVLILDLELRRT